MKAAVLYGKGNIRCVDVMEPTPRRGEVIVNVAVSGICGSDIPRFIDGSVHYFPIILGHEFSGRVVELGEGVEKDFLGKRVSVAPLVPCHSCNFCSEGSYSLCENYSFIGTRRQGGFAEYVSVPRKNLVRLEDNVSYEEGALFEPSTVALHGLKRLNYQGGEKVAIIGAGNIGIFLAQWAKILKAERVYLFDRSDKRLSNAEELDLDGIINFSREDFYTTLQEIRNKETFDYVFDAAGKEKTINLSLYLAGKKSKIVILGTPTKELRIGKNSFEQILRKELTVRGSWMSYSAPFPGDEWGLTSQYFSTGQLKIPKGMVFEKIPLSSAREAFELFKKPGNVRGKILLINEDFKG